MIIFPAIDLLDGHCVRLRQGDKDQKTVYNEDPSDQARKWQAAGAEWLHVVDLDGAFTGEQLNFPHISEIAGQLSLKIQLGGGIRSLDRAEKVLGLGVERIVLGTRAIEDIEFVAEAVQFFGAEHVVVGIDAVEGFVAVRGWEEITTKETMVVASEMAECGVQHVLYTDIKRDGMMSGPDFDRLRLLAIENPQLQVIASGGVSTMEDVRRVKAMADIGLEGMIIGRALYDGDIDLAEAIKEIRSAG